MQPPASFMQLYIVKPETLDFDLKNFDKRKVGELLALKNNDVEIKPWWYIFGWNGGGQRTNSTLQLKYQSFWFYGI